MAHRGFSVLILASFGFLSFVSAWAQEQQPSAGVILNRDRLESVLRNGGAESIFNSLRGQIASQVRDAFEEAELHTPKLLLNRLGRLKESRDAWLQLIEDYHRDDKFGLTDSEISKELQAWNEFFDFLNNLKPEEISIEDKARIENFFKTEVREGSGLERRYLLPRQIDLFQTSYSFSDTKNVNISRDFLQKPILQTEWLPTIPANREVWVSRIVERIDQADTTESRSSWPEERKAWSDFLNQLWIQHTNSNEDFSSDEKQKWIENFLNEKVKDGSDRRRRDILPVDFPLFKKQKALWLEALREAYTKNGEDEEPAWVANAIQNWSLVSDESEDWSLFVNYDVDFEFEVVGTSLAPQFNQQGPLASADVRAEIRPWLRVRYDIFLQNPSTGETLAVASSKNGNHQSSDKAWLQKSGSEWRFNENLRVDVPADVNFDIQSPRPMDLVLGEARTNLREVRIHPDDVDKFLADVLSPENVRGVLEQLRRSSREDRSDLSFSELQTYDRVFRQLGSDVKNYLKDRDIDLVVYLVRMGDGSIKTEVGVLDDALQERLEKLKSKDPNKDYAADEEVGLLAHFQSSIPLEVANANFNFDTSTQSLTADFGFLENRTLEWKVKHFEFPMFMLGDVENPLAQHILEGLRGKNFASDEIDIEASVRFPSLPEGEGGLQVRLPLEWRSVEGSNIQRPRIATERASVKLPGLEQAHLTTMRFRSAEDLPWVNVNFQNPQRITDQLYTQLHSVMQSITRLTGEDVFQRVESGVADLVQDRVSSMETQIPSEGAAPARPATAKITKFKMPKNAVDINWDAEQDFQNRVRIIDDPQLSAEYERLKVVIEKEFEDPKSFLPSNTRWNKKKQVWEISHTEQRRRVHGPNTFHENPTYSVTQWSELSADAIAQRREAAVSAEALRRLPGKFESGFDSLPDIYRMYENQPALHRVRTSVKFPKEIRVRIENFENEDARISHLEFSLKAEEEMELTVYWKFVQDARGNLLMIPELQNIREVLSAYKPVTEGTIQEGGPDIGTVAPKGAVKSRLNSATEAAGVAGRVTQIMGTMAIRQGMNVGEQESRSWWNSVTDTVLEGVGIVGGALTTGAGMAAEKVDDTMDDIKVGSVKSKLPGVIEEQSEKMSEDLVRVLVHRANGYLLNDLDEISEGGELSEEEVREIRESAPLRALQSTFEKLIQDDLVGRFHLREEFGKMEFDGANPVRLTEEKFRELIVDTVEGNGPVESWPDTFTNEGIDEVWAELAETAHEQVAELPATAADTIEGDIETDDPEAQTLNSTLHGDVHNSIEDGMNAPFEEIRISPPNAFDTPYSTNEEGPASQFQVNLPEWLCIASAEASPAENLVSIWAWYDQKESSYISKNPAPNLDQLIARYFQDRPEWSYRSPDGLLVMGVEDIQKNLLDPNLEAARQILNEQVKETMPGTELVLGNAKIQTDENNEPFALAELRVKSKQGFIKFDSGAEFLQIKIPLSAHISSTFDDRPAFSGSEVNPGYALTFMPEYPIEILDPNSGNIVDHLIKKYVAYPKLAEALVYEEKKKDGSRPRRVLSVPIPQTLGIPRAERDVKIGVRGLDFKTDSNGEAYIFAPLDFRQSRRKDPTAGQALVISGNALKDRDALNQYLAAEVDQEEFVFRRMFEALLADSDLKDREFRRNLPIHVDIQKAKFFDGYLAPSHGNNNQLSYVANIRIFQEGAENIRTPDYLRVSIPFDQYEITQDGERRFIIDPAGIEVVGWPPESELNAATKDFLNYLKTADPRALRVDNFRP